MAGDDSPVAKCARDREHRAHRFGGKAASPVAPCDPVSEFHVTAVTPKASAADQRGAVRARQGDEEAGKTRFRHTRSEFPRMLGRIGPRRGSQVADDPLVVDQAEQFLPVFRPAGSKEQPFAANEHAFSPLIRPAPRLGCAMLQGHYATAQGLSTNTLGNATERENQKRETGFGPSPSRYPARGPEGAIP